MATVSISLDGDSNEILSRIREAFGGMPEAVRSILKDPAKILRNQVIGGTPYLTGEAKRGWGELSRTARGYSFENKVPYIGVLEEGTYPGVGPRTVQTAKGIFSRQAPQGISEPVMTDENVQSIADAVSKLFQKIIDNASSAGGL